MGENGADRAPPPPAVKACVSLHSWEDESLKSQRPLVTERGQTVNLCSERGPRCSVR